MQLYEIVIIAEPEEISISELSQVGAAIQKQVTRDFSPIWEVNATVTVAKKAEDAPHGASPIFIQKDIHDDRDGFHYSPGQQPSAYVHYDANQNNKPWSLICSHECLEMLADPSGNRRLSGPSLMAGQGSVEYLVEVCDPCESIDFAYPIDGWPVSDFCTPNYFDAQAAPGVRYSQYGSLTEPRQILKDGYMSWYAPNEDQWWQYVCDGISCDFKPFTPDMGSAACLREAVDRATRVRYWKRPSKATRQRLAEAAEHATAARGAQARKWRLETERFARTNRPLVRKKKTRG
jgi:hypothetical protein